MYALVNCDVYTGSGVEYDKAVVIDNECIRSIVPYKELDNQIEKLDLGGLCVAPGFIDIQVNGGGGVLFNDSVNTDGVKRIVEAHRRYGTTNMLPTYITGPKDGMANAIKTVNDIMRSGLVKGLLGIHIEGPFINADKAGVHDKNYIREMDEEDFAVMCSPHMGVLLVTLAPEIVSTESIIRLCSAGIIVSLGHSNATYKTAIQALQNGASCITHLYNAMSALTSREPGMVGTALDHPDSWTGIIIDGYHTDFVSARIAIRSKAKGKTMLITDAMPPVGAEDPNHGYCLGDYEVSVKDGRCLTSDGVLAGSALDMSTAIRNCVQKIGIPLDEALRMASTYPAEFLGLSAQLGKIAPGYRANLAIFNNQLSVSAVLVDGEYHNVL